MIHRMIICRLEDNMYFCSMIKRVDSMKKRVLFLLPLFLGACSDSGESPVITNRKAICESRSGRWRTSREDYANRMSELPALKVGDKVDAFLSLDGNGAELKAFQLQNGEEMKTELRYEKTEVTTEGNLTDEEKDSYALKMA